MLNVRNFLILNALHSSHRKLMCLDLFFSLWCKFVCPYYKEIQNRDKPELNRHLTDSGKLKATRTEELKLFREAEDPYRTQGWLNLVAALWNLIVLGSSLNYILYFGGFRTTTLLLMSEIKQENNSPQGLEAFASVLNSVNQQ